MTIFISIVILGFLVFIHEAGHFFAAKRAGILVEEFGIGFPPRLFSIKKGETVYSLNLLPLGGFVKIYGEASEFRDDPRSFASKSIGVRTGIVFAGVAMNFLIGMVLLILAYSIGFPSPVTEENQKFVQNQSLVIARVLSGAPADVAGIQPGDVVVGLNGKKVDGVGFKELIQNHLGEEMEIVLERGGKEVVISVPTRKEYSPTEGSLGVALVDRGILKYPLPLAFINGIKDSFIIIGKIMEAFVGLFVDMFRGDVDRDAVSGPVGVFVLAGQAIQEGILYVIPLIILISFNLAVMNMIPFPALDGGRMFFFMIEKIKGQPISSRVEGAVHGAGFVALIILMFFLTLGDLKRFF